mmetsp:Transcript_2341/g.6299  ORF Transcript_2341/g.6299 Transcript_2341/m.6299 type:complete len:266 (-) Transcript_2341:1245-2042(-)
MPPRHVGPKCRRGDRHASQRALRTLYTAAQCFIFKPSGSPFMIASSPSWDTSNSERTCLTQSIMGTSPPMYVSVNLVSAKLPRTSKSTSGIFALASVTASSSSLGRSSLYLGSMLSIGSLLIICFSSFMKESTCHKCTCERAVAEGRLSGLSESTVRKYWLRSISPACSTLRPPPDLRMKEMDICTFWRQACATEGEASSILRRSVVSGIRSFCLITVLSSLPPASDSPSHWNPRSSMVISGLDNSRPRWFSSCLKSKFSLPPTP